MCHVDAAAEASERLVDRVVDDLPETVHEASGIGRADVHSGALAHRLETLEDGEMAGGVVGHRTSLTRAAHAGREAHPGVQPPNC